MGTTTTIAASARASVVSVISSLLREPFSPSPSGPRSAIDLRDWLGQCGVVLHAKQEPDVVSPSLNGFAEVFGRECTVLGPLLAAFRRKMSNPGWQAEVNLADRPPDQICRIVDTGSRLQAAGLLASFRYHRKPRIAGFEPAPDKGTKRFLQGFWLERYVLLQVVRRFSRAGAGEGNLVMTNVKARLPDGGDAEFDVLVSTPTRVYWFECKSGMNTGGYPRRYGQISRDVLGLPREQCALVVAKPLTALEKESIGAGAGLTVLHPSDLAAYLEREAARDLKPLPESLRNRRPAGCTFATQAVPWSARAVNPPSGRKGI